MDVKWVKMHPGSGSWHALQHESKVIEGTTAPHVTYCGREATGEIVDDLPGTDKGCEPCLRTVTRLQEAVGAL